MTPTEWLADLGKAADELGYGITKLTPRSVTLVEIRGASEVRLTSTFLSGDWLRQRLHDTHVSPKEETAETA